MSITLNIDKYLLCSMFNISAKKIDDQYSGMSIEEIMQAEAQQGNTSAAKFNKDVLSDPTKLIELFELQDPSNKYAILSNMNQEDLNNLLPMLSSEDLVQGLNYFSKDKLCEMMQSMPQDQVMNLTFSMFSDEHIMQMMPDQELNKMLSSPELNKQQEINFLPSINPEIMAKMIQQATGQQAAGVLDSGMDGKPKYDVSQLTNQLASLPDDQFQGALLSMPTQNKQAFVYLLTIDNPNLFKSVSSGAYTDMISQKKDKQDILRYSNAINPDQLTKMVSKLPKELTSVVLTQMDTSKFAHVLLANFKNVIGQIAAG